MPPTSLSLAPYQGVFSASESSHLIRRSTFIHGQAARNQAAIWGLTETINQLLSIDALPEPPLNYGANDPAVPVGTTWVDQVFTFDSLVYRRTSLSAWTAEQLAKPEIRLREKMVLFWHNHFAIAGIGDPQYLYFYSNTLRTHALGNFRDLVKAITVDPSMLRFLNGNSNTGASPNENYARELLELFTIGKGPLAGPGDYTFYTEEDVKEMARVLTGWIDLGYGGIPAQSPSVTFLPFRHDRGTKQLSHRFGNATINNMGENEYSHLIDLIFQQPEVARFICRKIYRYFIYYDITEDIENTVIAELAQTLINNDYEIVPVLRQLLSSEHFFDNELLGCQIKNPYEFLMPLFSTFQTTTPQRLANRYAFYSSIFYGAGLLDMNYYEIPQVAGWKAYYQEPVYYRYWINNVTLNLRKTIIDLVLVTGIQAGDERITPDLLAFIATLPDPSDPNKLIEDTGRLFFTQSVTSDQIEYYKEILIPGLPDFEWTLEYNNFLANPDDELLKLAIQLKLITLFSKMLNAPDFHLQ